MPREEGPTRLVSAAPDRTFDARGVAARFVQARRSADSFSEYPGTMPPDLDAAYRCQDEAIALWQDAVAGWKVGGIPEQFSVRYGAQRLVGPIFARSLQRARGDEPLVAPVFARGFAAIEAEFVFQLAADAPAGVTEWDAGAARDLAGRLFIGIEIASSPLQNINDFGPAAVVSDFGNNAGLLLGAEIAAWRSLSLDRVICETRIEGASVGRGTATGGNDGPFAALAFALRCNARRGRPLRAGDLVSTGAVTGVHPVTAGQSAEVIFTGIGSLRCSTVPATAQAGAC